MNLPKKDFKIRVSPYNVDVLYREKCPTKVTKDKYVQGDWDIEKLTITLSTKHNTKPDQMTNTFLHEVLHALVDTTGIDINKKWTEEFIVDRLSHGLQAFISDNPKLFK